MTLPNEDFAYIQKLLRTQTGFLLAEDKRYLVESRLEPLAQRECLDGITNLIAHLRSHHFGYLHRQALEAMMTHETWFFRDQFSFDALKEVALPDLIQARKLERKLCLWSAACANGQEAYSIAMLLREHFPMLLNWKLTIVASDFSQAALNRAQEGIYGDSELRRGLSVANRNRYFLKKDNGWQVHPNLQKMIEFRRLNLIEAWGNLPDMDIVFLRNVLIYLDPEARRQILEKMQRVMRRDSYLFLGHSETPFPIQGIFDPVHFANTVVYRLK